MRTLCIYALHEYNYNVDFFINNGLFNDPNVDFYFVINNPDLKIHNLPHDINCTVINRSNINLDNGAWSHVLFTKNNDTFLYEKYDYFIFLNGTVRGPFLPVWQKDKNWAKLFTDQLTDDLKLFGTMICFFDHKAHVQSMCFATDRVGLQIGIDNKIFEQDGPPLCKSTICIQKEIGYSTAILDAGYNIGCMLKAYDNIDFRKNRGTVNTLCFFEPYSYFGTNIHPHEIIFCKVMGDDRQSGHNKEILDKYTNWQYESQKISVPSFDWVYYLIKYEDLRKAGIKSEQHANAHYNTCGRNEMRDTYHHSNTISHLRIDLNPLRTSGLINQMWSLVNGILLGHCTGKHIVVSGFYADYNQNRTVPIQDLIDIPALNCLIVKLGLHTHVTTHLNDVTWKPSNYMNPTKTLYSDCGFIDTIAFLKSESDKYIDISDTFCDNMFRKNSDERYQHLFTDLISGLIFSTEVKEIVNYIKLSVGIPSSYKAIHLRLEDDIIKLRPFKDISEQEYGDSVYQKYKGLFQAFFDSNDTIFVATHLIKSENRYNYVINELKSIYPKMVMTNNWREQFPKFHLGRDIDALIDYALCLDSNFFIGYGFSTFSQAIKFKHDQTKTPVALIY
jgi:hypothetical protein